MQVEIRLSGFFCLSYFSAYNVTKSSLRQNLEENSLLCCEWSNIIPVRPCTADLLESYDLFKVGNNYFKKRGTVVLGSERNKKSICFLRSGMSWDLWSSISCIFPISNRTAAGWIAELLNVGHILPTSNNLANLQVKHLFCWSQFLTISTLESKCPFDGIKTISRTKYLQNYSKFFYNISLESYSSLNRLKGLSSLQF